MVSYYYSMSVESAFRSRKAQPTPERVVAGEPPLESLEKERGKTDSFDYFFRAVREGFISSPQELRARLNPRFSYTNGRTILVDNNDQTILGRNGSAIPETEVSQSKKIRSEDQILTLTRLCLFSKETKENLSKALNEVGSIAYFFRALDIRRFGSPQEFRAHLNPRFGYVNGRTILVDNNDQAILGRNGQAIPETEVSLSKKVGDRRIQSELGVISTKMSGWSTSEKQAADLLDRTAYHRRSIIQGTVSSPKEFRARLNPRFSYTNGRTILVDNNDQPILGKNGQAIPETDVAQSKKVMDPEERRLLEELYFLTRDPSVPEDLRQNLIRHLEKGERESRERMTEVMQASGTAPLWRARIDTLLDAMAKMDRQAALKKRFYTVVNKPEGRSFENVQEMFAGYNQQDVDDQTLVQELSREALVWRRLALCCEFINELSRTTQRERDFDAVLRILTPLFQSPDPSDREIARLLMETAYQLETATYQASVDRQLSDVANGKEIFQYINNLPVRPTADTTDYTEFNRGLKDTVATIVVQLERNRRRKTANEIRGLFPNARSIDILKKIQDFPSETDEDIAMKEQLLDLYRSYVASERPDIFDATFKGEIVTRMQEELKERHRSPELGNNMEAFRYLRGRFRETLFPLGEVFRDDPRTKDAMDSILRPVQVEGRRVNPAIRYIQRIKELEKQRPLTDIERTYLESIELLSLFSPYMIAIANADEGVALEYLNHHFERLSDKTARELQDGDYVPLLQIGLGPNGLAALGEVARNNPVLASQMLVVDEGELPGGPFAVPRGPAWELNSANKRGGAEVVLTAAPGENELKTIRSFGSPATRWYPGERLPKQDTRAGSINTTVDYMITPDDLSITRYPTNEELHLVLSLQAALLTKRMLLKTRVKKVEPNTDTTVKGNKIVTLEIEEANGQKRTIRIRTDGEFVIAGLGESTYGFPFQGSRAEKVVEAQKESKGFPKLSKTLETFRALSKRAGEKKSPGRTMVIYGRGNSADTIIENVSSIFQSDNPLVRDITKVYLIADGDLSARPRYAAISDLKPRNGRGNLIEQVRARVTDVDFATQKGKVEERQLVLLDERGQRIADSEGRPIMADSVVAATGFRSNLNDVFSAYLNKGQSFQSEGSAEPLEALTLPTDPDVPVADTLKADPDILFLGTASKPRFSSVAKLAQLPAPAREALLRNGAENAVAIGFRAPDTQAAVNIWLNSRDTVLDETSTEERVKIANAAGPVTSSTEIAIPNRIMKDDRAIPNNISSETLLLSPLIAYELANRIQLLTSAKDKTPYQGEIRFEVSFDAENDLFELQFKAGKLRSISQDLFEAVSATLDDTYVQRYTLSALARRRRNPRLEIVLAFNKGVVDPRNTYVQEM